MITTKKLRRVSVGPVVTLTFENRMTVRFQVQEMARAERMVHDAQIQHELDVYNRLLPAPGELSATLFVELTSEDELRTWLPRLVGVERACQVRIGSIEGDDGPDVVPSIPETEYESQLTREEVTSAVHYVRFRLNPAHATPSGRDRSAWPSLIRPTPTACPGPSWPTPSVRSWPRTSTGSEERRRAHRAPLRGGGGGRDRSADERDQPPS